MTELNLKPMRYTKTSLIKPAANKRLRPTASKEQNADYWPRREMSISVVRYLTETARHEAGMRVSLCLHSFIEYHVHTASLLQVVLVKIYAVVKFKIEAPLIALCRKWTNL